MSIALAAAAALSSPLHHFLRWINTSAVGPTPAIQARQRYAPRRPQSAVSGCRQEYAFQRAQPMTRNAPSRPLRVVRILESDQQSGHAGRMVISGRLDDVCAELDRLAAREAAMH